MKMLWLLVMFAAVAGAIWWLSRPATPRRTPRPSGPRPPGPPPTQQPPPAPPRPGAEATAPTPGVYTTSFAGGVGTQIVVDHMRTLPNQVRSSVDWLTSLDAGLEVALRLRRSPHRCLVVGSPGSGKTVEVAEVIHNALERARHQPSGAGIEAAVLVDLGGSGPSPLSADEAMWRVVRAFDTLAPRPRSAAGIRETYARQCAERPFFLLLDDAGDAAQVEPLLTHEGPRVVLTAPKLLPLESVEVVELGPLERGEDVLNWYGVPEQDVEALFELCERSTVALTLAQRVTRASGEAAPRVRARLAELREGGKEALEAALEVALEALPDTLADDWRALAVFAGSFDAAAAAAVWDVDVDEARERLAELEDRVLVHHLVGGRLSRRLSVPRALRRFAPPASDALAERHARHFLSVLLSAAKTSERSPREAAVMFDEDEDNILRAWASTGCEGPVGASYATGAVELASERLAPERWRDLLERTLGHLREREQRWEDGELLLEAYLTFCEALLGVEGARGRAEEVLAKARAAASAIEREVTRAVIRVAAVQESGAWLDELLAEVDAQRPGLSRPFRLNAVRAALRVGEYARATALLEQACEGLPALDGREVSLELGQLSGGLQAIAVRVELDDHLQWVAERGASAAGTPTGVSG